MDFEQRLSRAITRRTLLGQSARGLGSLALASLLNGGLDAPTTAPGPGARTAHCPRCTSPPRPSA